MAVGAIARRAKAQKARRINPAVKALLVIGALYLVGNLLVTAIKLQVQTNEKKAELQEVQAKITSQTVENEKLNNILNAQVDSEYVEDIARDMGYGDVGERVYDNITD